MHGRTDEEADREESRKARRRAAGRAFCSACGGSRLRQVRTAKSPRLYGAQATPVLDAQGMRETPRVRLNMRQ
jgi:hypothetical protein